MKKFLIVVIGTTFLLSGCASVGSSKLKGETEQTVSSKIHKNITTKKEIQQIFGPPNDTNFTDSGRVIWEYMRGDQTTKVFIPFLNRTSETVRYRKLKIIFNEDDTVQNFSFIDGLY